LQVPVQFLDQLGWVILLPFLFLTFPDGRFVPRWTRWLGLIWLVVSGWSIVQLFFSRSTAEAERPTPALEVMVWLSIWVIGLSAQIYRYIRVSGPVQRQQTKWVVLGLAGAVLGIVGAIAISLVFPPADNLRRSGWAQLMVEPLLVSAGFLLLPLSLSFAILHSHLWNIDFLINRTLVYSTLTAALTLLYVGSVVVLQQLFRNFTGQESDLAFVASTVLFALLFSPLRCHIQVIIDRRFYRRKYDAQRVLAAFGAQLRAETNLDPLLRDLVYVVEDSLQPTHVSVWLRPLAAEKERPPQ